MLPVIPFRLVWAQVIRANNENASDFQCLIAALMLQHITFLYGYYNGAFFMFTSRAKNNPACNPVNCWEDLLGVSSRTIQRCLDLITPPVLRKYDAAAGLNYYTIDIRSMRQFMSAVSAAEKQFLDFLKHTASPTTSFDAAPHRSWTWEDQTVSPVDQTVSPVLPREDQSESPVLHYKESEIGEENLPANAGALADIPITRANPDPPKPSGRTRAVPKPAPKPKSKWAQQQAELRRQQKEYAAQQAIRDKGQHKLQEDADGNQITYDKSRLTPNTDLERLICQLCRAKWITEAQRITLNAKVTQYKRDDRPSPEEMWAQHETIVSEHLRECARIRTAQAGGRVSKSYLIQCVSSPNTQLYYRLLDAIAGKSTLAAADAATERKSDPIPDIGDSDEW